MRGISSSELFHGPFHAAFLIKASRPENTFKLSWTLNPSGAFHSPWEQKGKQRVKKEEARQREAGEEGKERRSFLSRLSSLAVRWEDACTRANSKERERERGDRVHTLFLSKRKTSVHSGKMATRRGQDERRKGGRGCEGGKNRHAFYLSRVYGNVTVVLP